MQIMALFFPSPSLPPWSVAIPNVDRKLGLIASSGALSVATETYLSSWGFCLLAKGNNWTDFFKLIAKDILWTVLCTTSPLPEPTCLFYWICDAHLLKKVTIKILKNCIINYNVEHLWMLITNPSFHTFILTVASPQLKWGIECCAIHCNTKLQSWDKPWLSKSWQFQ